MIVLKACWRSSKEVPMAIRGRLDVHRSQITYDWIDPDTSQRQHGRLAPATREHQRCWLEQFAGKQAAFALEGCTGWRYVVEELKRAGIEAHLAEPADTSAARGPKRRAKTDQLDARHLRELLATGRLPESWISPAHVLEVRTQVRCYKALLDEHTASLQGCTRPCSTMACPPSATCWPQSGARGWSEAAACHRPPASWSRSRCAPWITDALTQGSLPSLSSFRNGLASVKVVRPCCAAGAPPNGRVGHRADLWRSTGP
jgi:hypothetical protein